MIASWPCPINDIESRATPLPSRSDDNWLLIRFGRDCMCGIVAYVGKKIAQPLLIEGLKRLEYRGYDSAGIAVIDQSGNLHIRRAVGRISVLENALQGDGLPPASIGMAHTR